VSTRVEPPSSHVAPSSAHDSESTSISRPRIALFIATVCGLGRIPQAPGTWGSLAGVLLYALSQIHYHPDGVLRPDLGYHARWNAGVVLPAALLIALIGTWAAGRTSSFSGQKDPQFVVIDEVSGQLFTYLLAVSPPNWKYLLAGFILFRVFDIWKPFPVRQAESLPGGWGIMADDWVAGAFAAGALWVARGAGL